MGLADLRERGRLDAAPGRVGEVHGHVSAAGEAALVVVANGRPALARGEALSVGLGEGRVYLFDGQGAAI